MTDVWTKLNDDYFPDIDWCADCDVIPEVAELYQKHRKLCNRFITPAGADRNRRKYYVYAWRTVEEPKRYFYVGRGTGSRYRHILTDIKTVEEKKKRNSRFEQYAIIRDKCGGITADFLLKDLTEYEAIIYEEAVKLDFLARGEVLLCVEGIPYEYLPDGWKETPSMIKPTLESDPFYRKYLYPDEPYFDEIDLSKIPKAHVWLGNIPMEEFHFAENIEKAINMKIIESGGKVTKGLSVKNSAVIIIGYFRERYYRDLREMGLDIYDGYEVGRLLNI